MDGFGLGGFNTGGVNTDGFNTGGLGRARSSAGGLGMGGLDMGGLDVDPRLRGNDLSAIERRLGPDAAAGMKAPGAPAAAGGTKARGRGPIDRNSRLYRACEDFEALFIKQMLSSMRKTINKTGLMDGGMAEEIFEDMLYDEYALKMARTAGFGLSDTLYRELSRDPSVRSRSL